MRWALPGAGGRFTWGRHSWCSCKVCKRRQREGAQAEESGKKFHANRGFTIAQLQHVRRHLARNRRAENRRFTLNLTSPDEPEGVQAKAGRGDEC